MSTSGLCMLCRPGPLIPGTDDVYVPEHCYGRGDNPAPAGVMGGFRCSCPCRGERS